MIPEYGGCSHRGKVRKTNEDYYYIPQNGEDRNLAMIADGMGGHNAGELASRMAVETILDNFPSGRTGDMVPDEIMGTIRETIEITNKKVYEYSITHDECQGMGTTLVLAILVEGNLYLGHIGDSRAYIVRDRKVCQITKDHSLVQELLDKGTITQDEVANHPQKNVITRALGTEDTIEVDLYELPLMDGDIVLLCTDGLTLHVDLSEEIEVFESGYSMDELADSLVHKAITGGGLDNITVVAIKYSRRVKEG